MDWALTGALPAGTKASTHTVQGFCQRVSGFPTSLCDLKLPCPAPTPCPCTPHTQRPCRWWALAWPWGAVTNRLALLSQNLWLVQRRISGGPLTPVTSSSVNCMTDHQLLLLFWVTAASHNWVSWRLRAPSYVIGTVPAV